jgi:hypothetical protein
MIRMLNQNYRNSLRALLPEATGEWISMAWFALLRNNGTRARRETICMQIEF